MITSFLVLDTIQDDKLCEHERLSIEILNIHTDSIGMQHIE